MTAEYEELRRRLPQEVSSLKLQIEAADAIEALSAENKKLREALENLLFFPNDEGSRGHAEEALSRE
jgi:hypothetical protein